MTARVGYVHFGGNVGDLVRVEAIRRFFDEERIAYREFALTQERRRVDIVRELFSAVGVRHLSRKILRDRQHPLMKELNWHIEARQWQENVEEGARSLAPQVGGLDILHAETLAAGLVCLQLKQARGLPFVYDMHGVVGEEAKLTGSSEWASWCQASERRVMQAADYVLAVSQLMANYVAEVYGVARDKILVLPNGSYVSERQAKFAEPLKVIYAGNFAAFERVMEFVRTAELCAGDHCQFWLLGDGALRNEVFDYINKNFVDIIYYGRKPRAVAMDYCAAAQVGFSGHAGCLNVEQDFPQQICCPIKIFDYAACGLPVIVPKGEWSALVAEADCGIVVETCEAKAFAEAIEQLRDRAVWERQSRNAKELIRSRFQWSQVLAPLRALYKGVAAGSPTSL